MRRCGLILLGGLTVAGCGGGDGGGGGPPTITSVIIGGDSTVVLAGTRQLSATAKSGSTTVTGVTFQWSSSDTTRATVTSAGLVSGVRLGSATMTAQAVVNGTPTGVFSAPHGIRTRIGSIAITPGTPQFASLGDSVLAIAEARDAQSAAVPGVTFTWESRTSGVATATARVNTTQADLVAVGNGTSRIVVRADGISDSITATVQQIAATLSVTPSTATLHSVGATLTPGVSATDARGNPVSGSAVGWTSTNTSAATVATTGVITAVNEGQSDVIASSGSIADTVAVTVDQIPKTVVITPANFGTPDVTLTTNQTAPFYAVVLDSLNQPALHDTVVWSTDNAAVANHGGGASLDSTVITTFATAGTATITATATPASATRVVNVSATPISFATQVLTVLTGAANCDGCHPPNQNLNLTAAQAYTNIVGVNATEVMSLKRVRPFRPDSSYLVHKIQGTQSTVGGFGARMPLGCAGASCLSNTVINTIRNWILQGALNN